MPDGRLLVVYYASGNGVSENRVLELLPDGTAGTPVALGLAHPFTQYFTATPRAGSAPSRTFDMLGQQAGTGTKMTYARVRF